MLFLVNSFLFIFIYYYFFIIKFSHIMHDYISLLSKFTDV